MTVTDRRLHFLALAVFLDLFAVALVVPLLPIKMKELGAQPATIGLVGSLYSAAGIVGGIVLGALSDRVLSRRTVLLISFSGAAFSYAMVGVASSIWMLLLSRVVVGLVKQTMTISTAMAASWSTPEDRASAVGYISSAVTVAFLSGSAVTTTLAMYMPSLPTIIAVSLYGVDAVLVLCTLPATETSTANSNKDSSLPAERAGFFASFRRAFGDGAVARVLLVKIMYNIVSRAFSSLNSFWEQERFGLNLAKLSMLNTVRSVLSITLKGFVVGPVIKRIGERHALLVACALAVVDSLFGATITDISWFLALSTPVGSLGSFLADIGLKSLFTQVVPQSEVGAALGVLDVLNSACGVIAPLLGGVVLQYGGLLAKPVAEGIAYLGLLTMLLLGVLPASPDTNKSKAE